MRSSPGKFLPALALLLLATPAFCDDTPPVKTPDETIASVLRHGDTVVAATKDGIYTASVKDKTWHKSITPDAIPLMGRLVAQGPDAPLLACYSSYSFMFSGLLENLPPPPGGKPKPQLDGILISNDDGKTWALTAPGKNFCAVFIHPNGNIFAVECVQSPEPPPSGQAATTDKHGAKIYLYTRMLLSTDKGATWKEISNDFPSGYDEFSLFADPDHDGQVCFSAISNWHTERPNIYQADDANYQWKRHEATAWRNAKTLSKVADNEAVFPFPTGDPNNVIVASLGNYFDHEFKDGGIGVLLAAGVHAVAAKSAYTFHAGDPKIITVKVVDEIPGPAVKFPDNKDETIFWGMLVSEKGKITGTLGIRAVTEKSSDFLSDAGTKTEELDPGHPYERQIDLSKFHDFTQPGDYKVELTHADGGFAHGAGTFSSQVIDITITP